MTMTKNSLVHVQIETWTGLTGTEDWHLLCLIRVLVLSTRNIRNENNTCEKGTGLHTHHFSFSFFP